MVLCVCLPWGHGGPRPSGGSGAQPLGSAECNGCRETPGGAWVSDKLPLTVCDLALTLREPPAGLVGRQCGKWPTQRVIMKGWFGEMGNLLSAICHGLQLAQTRPILCLSLKTEVVLTPGKLEARPGETEEDGGAEARCGLDQSQSHDDAVKYKHIFKVYHIQVLNHVHIVHYTQM